MNLKAILQDTLWALVVNDPGDDHLTSCFSATARASVLQQAGMHVTTAGVLRPSHEITPAIFIHNISPTQIESIIETNPPLLLTPNILRFRDGFYTPDQSTLEVFEGGRNMKSLKAVPYCSGPKRTVHVGIFHSIDTTPIPKDSPSIPFLKAEGGGGMHSNCFVYSNQRARTGDQNAEEVERLCALRDIDMYESSDILVRETKAGLLTARSQRFRNVLAQAAGKSLLNPQIFGYRYKDENGAYLE